MQKETRLDVLRLCAPVWGVSIYALYCAYFWREVSVLFWLCCILFSNSHPFDDRETPDDAGIRLLHADVISRRAFLALQVLMLCYEVLFYTNRSPNIYIAFFVGGIAVHIAILSFVFVRKALAAGGKNEADA